MTLEYFRDILFDRIRPRFFYFLLPTAAPQAILSLRGERKYGERAPFKATKGFLENLSFVPTAEMIWL